MHFENTMSINSTRAIYMKLEDLGDLYFLLYTMHYTIIIHGSIVSTGRCGFYLHKKLC